jgi:hypothetical protein
MYQYFLKQFYQAPTEFHTINIKMTFPTKSAFIHEGTWDEASRQHPATEWMEQFTHAFNARSNWDQAYSDWHTSDFTMIKPDGTVHHGNEEGFKQIKALYEPFTNEYHQPYFSIWYEIDEGYEMLGLAHLYGNLVGEPGADETKYEDDQGRQWDVKIPGAFRFAFRKTDKAAHGGFEMSRAEILSDSMPAVMILSKRGVLKM